MFPSGIAGVALLLLRVICAFPLVWPNGMRNLAIDPTFIRLFATALALFLLCGAFTPIACSLVVFEGLFAFRGLEEAVAYSFVLHLLTTASLMMLGPGAYSIDAKLFGRRLIVPPQA